MSLHFSVLKIYYGIKNSQTQIYSSRFDKEYILFKMYYGRYKKLALFLQNGNRDRSLMSLLRSKVQLFSNYKNEDKVSINSTQGEMTFPKPRTTAFILSMVKYQTAFFIEDTGVKQVGDSFHQLGKNYIWRWNVYFRIQLPDKYSAY
jgi:hypothetical protein